MIAGSAFQKYGQELEKHQQTLLGLSDILIEIYFAESATLRTIKNFNRGYDVDHQINMTKLYVFDAAEIVIGKSKETIGNIAEVDAEIKLMKSLHLLTKYEKLPNVPDLRNKIADKIIMENGYGF